MVVAVEVEDGIEVEVDFVAEGEVEGEEDVILAEEGVGVVAVGTTQDQDTMKMMQMEVNDKRDMVLMEVVTEEVVVVVIVIDHPIPIVDGGKLLSLKPLITIKNGYFGN